MSLMDFWEEKNPKTHWVFVLWTLLKGTAVVYTCFWTKNASLPDNTGKLCVSLCACVRILLQIASSSATETSFREEQESSPAGLLSSNW